jgi:hypothetical protein
MLQHDELQTIRELEFRGPLLELLEILRPRDQHGTRHHPAHPNCSHDCQYSSTEHNKPVSDRLFARDFAENAIAL